MTWFAHSANSQGIRQPLHQHLERVAALAAQHAQAFGAADLAAALGRLHDIGKVHPDFQAYLLAAEGGGARPRGPDHKAAGAVLAMRRQYGGLALALLGHHGGLPALADAKALLEDPALRSQAETAIAQAQAHLPHLAESAIPPPAWPVGLQHDPLYAEALVRFLFSALVDADYLDTAAHFHPRDLPEQPPVSELWQRFEVGHARFGAPRSPVDHVRSAVYRHCLDAAALEPGLFRLAVPTGGGKTLSALAFALRHAQAHGLRRVVVALPYLTITEQTVQAYRAVLGAQAVLEHHSQASEPAEDSWMRLAAENWDAPVIVTTTVQLLESLFTNQPSRARKLHRLARSVIILDEAQTLPVHLLDATLDMLRLLASRFGSTIVLSTATQPAFDLIPTFRGLAARDMVPEPERYYAQMQRVRYELRGALAWSDIAAEMADCPQALAVVNTKADALALLDALEARGCQPLHLSTLLCGAHRRAVIAEIRRRLAAGRPCLLVSTQVVEAGVDIDFPVVFRAVAPLDSIIQAAGRCNREGRLERGRVVVFEAAEGHTPPGFYRTATDEARTVLARGVDLNTLDGVQRYYELLYRDVDTDRERIQALRRAFDYPAVAARYRLIADETLPAVALGYAPRPARLQALLDALRARKEDPRHVMRQLQPYLVSIYRSRADAYLRQGLLTEVLPTLYLWHGRYDRVRGIVPLPGEPADLVI
jgi:CRISPR-associated endonuclease/helicase Cas3